MDKRQTVYQNGVIIAVIMCARVIHILIDDLQTVPVDILAVNEHDILHSTIIAD